MSKQKEVILSGVGGQGLIVCGTLLGEAAVLFDGRKATLSSEYGVETRGTFAKSDVIISDEQIDYPEAVAPDLVLCLAQVAYQRYAGKLPENTLLLYDSDQVTPVEGAGKQEGFPITTMARELGSAAAANILAMGLVSHRADLVSPAAGKAAIDRFFAGRNAAILEMNHRAFDMGYAL